jgi:hypothetical protein
MASSKPWWKREISYTDLVEGICIIVFSIINIRICVPLVWTFITIVRVQLYVYFSLHYLFLTTLQFFSHHVRYLYDYDYVSQTFPVSFMSYTITRCWYIKLTHYITRIFSIRITSVTAQCNTLPSETPSLFLFPDTSTHTRDWHNKSFKNRISSECYKLTGFPYTAFCFLSDFSFLRGKVEFMCDKNSYSIINTNNNFAVTCKESDRRLIAANAISCLLRSLQIISKTVHKLFKELFIWIK